VQKTNRVHHYFYYFLFIVVASSVTAVVYGMKSDAIFTIYHGIYFGILLLYTWYVLILLFFGELKKDKYPKYKGQKLAVIMPVYNEESELFERALKSVAEAHGNKDIYVVDDGSIKGVRGEQLAFICKKYGAILHVFNSNRGKRHALHHVVSALVSDHEFVVTIDSDTILDKDALVRVVEPLALPNIGASTGDVQLLNEKTNMLTRMIGAYYWVGLNIFKKAQSTIGIVVCCSGCLAAYKAALLKKHIDELVNQKFLGESCTHSEDRHLTNLVLRSGYQVKYVPEAISITSTPDTLRGFLKQQQRWKRGFIRESTYTLTYAWKTRPVLFLQILLCELTMPFMAFGLTLALLISLAVNPLYFLNVVLPSWLVFMVVRYFPILFYGKRKIPGLVMYMFLYEAILYWQFIHALFTVKNKSWVTRG
jgi:hyaluronan synthase